MLSAEWTSIELSQVDANRPITACSADRHWPRGRATAKVGAGYFCVAPTAVKIDAGDLPLVRQDFTGPRTRAENREGSKPIHRLGAVFDQ